MSLTIHLFLSNQCTDRLTQEAGTPCRSQQGSGTQASCPRSSQTTECGSSVRPSRRPTWHQRGRQRTGPRCGRTGTTHGQGRRRRRSSTSPGGRRGPTSCCEPLHSWREFVAGGRTVSRRDVRGSAPPSMPMKARQYSGVQEPAAAVRESYFSRSFHLRVEGHATHSRQGRCGRC